MSSSTSGGAAHPEAAGPRHGETFRERMAPAPWVLASGLMLGVLAGLTFFPFGWYVALTAVVVFSGMILTALLFFSPVVVLADGRLDAGQASIPVAMLGTATALDAAEMRHALGPGLDVRAYLCMRGWIATGVRVDLDDPEDPTPYWLLSSRDPKALVAALEAARAASGQA